MDNKAHGEETSKDVVHETRRQPWVAILNKIKQEKKDPDKRNDDIESIPDDEVPEMFTYEEGVYYNHTG
jgi:hypothetical protein